MASAWRNLKNIFSRPLFTIIFRPEMLKFHPYSILTGDTMVGFVIFYLLKPSFLMRRMWRWNKIMVIYLLLCCNVVIFYEAHLLSSSANFLPTTYNFAFSYKTFNELNPAQHSGLEGLKIRKYFDFLFWWQLILFEKMDFMGIDCSKLCIDW